MPAGERIIALTHVCCPEGGSRAVTGQCMRSGRNHSDQHVSSGRAGSALGPVRGLRVLVQGHMSECARGQHRVMQWIERAQAHRQIDVLLGALARPDRPSVHALA